MAFETEEEIFADNLSDNDNKSDLQIEDFECSSDAGILNNHLVLPILEDGSSDSEGSEEDSEAWTETDSPPVLEQFLGEPRVNASIGDPQSIAEVVGLFIGEDFFEYIAYESNRYYLQNQEKFKRNKKTLKWKKVEAIEMKKMLGLILLMGIVRKDKKEDYWSTDPTTETPIFPKVMSRERFRQIWTAWHFSNNEDVDQNSDRLIKIAPILHYFIPKFNSIYSPEQQLSIDESIIPWRGRLSFRVYNSEKVMKYGMLVRMVCEASSGYICNLEIQTEKGSLQKYALESLLSPYFNLWHHVYMDNYYTSVKKSKVLLNHKIRICGTIKENRGFPKCLKNLNILPSATVFRRNKDVLLQVWRSNRIVRMISTIHPARMVEDRKVKEKMKKPISVIDYNKYTKGADRADHFLSDYEILKSTRKWTKRVVLYLINCALYNAYCVWKNFNKTRINYKKFRHETARLWILGQNNNENSECDPGPSATLETTKRANKFDHPLRMSMDIRKHQLTKIVSTGAKRQLQRRCRVCSVHKKRSETCYICKFCQVPLHKGECFNRYHTLDKY